MLISGHWEKSIVQKRYTYIHAACVRLIAANRPRACFWKAILSTETDLSSQITLATIVFSIFKITVQWT